LGNHQLVGSGATPGRQQAISYRTVENRLSENRAAVGKKLRRGEYDGLVQTGMGRTDELVYLMASLKFLLARQSDGIVTMIPG